MSHWLEYCGDCDGVGWVEGGSALQTTCGRCGGSGMQPRPTEVLGPCPCTGCGEPLWWTGVYWMPHDDLLQFALLGNDPAYANGRAMEVSYRHSCLAYLKRDARNGTEAGGIVPLTAEAEALVNAVPGLADIELTFAAGGHKSSEGDGITAADLEAQQLAE